MKEEEHKHGPSADKIHPRAVEWLNHEIIYSCSSWGRDGVSEWCSKDLSQRAGDVAALHAARQARGRQMEGKGMAEAVKAVDQARGKAVRLVSDLQRKLESRGASGPFLSKLEGNAADDLCMGSPVLAEALKKEAAKAAKGIKEGNMRLLIRLDSVKKGLGKRLWNRILEQTLEGLDIPQALESMAEVRFESHQDTTAHGDDTPTSTIRVRIAEPSSLKPPPEPAPSPIGSPRQENSERNTPRSGGAPITPRTPRSAGAATPRTPRTDGGGTPRTPRSHAGGTPRTPRSHAGGTPRTPRAEGGETRGDPGGVTATSRGGGGMVAAEAPIVSNQATTVSPAQQPANGPHYKGTPLRSPGDVGRYLGAGKEVVFAEADETLPMTPKLLSGSARMRSKAEASNSAGRSAAASSGHGHDGGEDGPVTAGLISSDYTQAYTYSTMVGVGITGTRIEPKVCKWQADGDPEAIDVLVTLLVESVGNKTDNADATLEETTRRFAKTGAFVGAAVRFGKATAAAADSRGGTGTDEDGSKGRKSAGAM